MKQLSKMMLAAVASVALAAPAFAWDFSASGSSSATFNVTSTTAYSGANAVSSGGFASDGGALTLKSGHTDGDTSASLSYALDWDGNMDETWTLSGSKKVGKWTASGDLSYNVDTIGCYASSTIDNGTSSAASSCGTTGGSQTAKDTSAITVTDGTMTIKLGDASHLSGQNVSSGSSASGALTFDDADDEASVGAYVGGFHGVSLGYKINDAMTATVAYQADSGYGDMLGNMEGYDSESAHYGTSTTGSGIGFTGDFGIATVGLTVASASTADSGGPATTALTTTTSVSTTGLGVKIDLGDIKPFISYGSYDMKGSVSENGKSGSGQELGLTYALGSDTVVFYYGSISEIETTSGTAAEALNKTGMEIGYNTTVGPASLSLGYGSKTKAQTDVTTVDGYSMTDIDVTMGFSF